jgi:hypothetical protein
MIMAVMITTTIITIITTHYHIPLPLQ